MNHTHKRQNSTGNFSSGLNVDQNNPLETSFSSLAYFMNVTKLMVITDQRLTWPVADLKLSLHLQEDEIMVPTKLKDKTFGA